MKALFQKQPMSQQELLATKRQVDAVNKQFKKKDGSLKGEMGQNSFLKLLVTQLQHQDPTKPMENTEFISQMAQFSALEQMTQINKSVEKLGNVSRSAEAFSILGKQVDAVDGKTGKPIQGTVSSIFYKGNDVKLIVKGRELDLADIHAVHTNPSQEKRAPQSRLSNNKSNSTAAGKVSK